MGGRTKEIPGAFPSSLTRRSSSTSDGRSSRLSPSGSPAGSSRRLVGRRLNGIEERLETRDGLAWVGERRSVDLRVAARAVDPGNTEEPGQHEIAAVDFVFEPVERPYRRPGNTVPFPVELAAVAGTTESGRL